MPNQNGRNLTLAALKLLGSLTDPVVDIIQKKRAILDNITWKECNKGDANITGILAGYAQPIWKGFYQGTPNTAGKIVSITDTCGLMSSRSAPDKQMIDNYPDSGKARYELDLQHQAGQADTFAQTFWYNNLADQPKAFMGLTPRFNNMSAPNGVNIIDGGGKGSNNTSIWLICNDDSVIHGIFPQGTQAGLHEEDLGVIQQRDDNGNEYSAYGREYMWNCGLTVKDWRYIVRICNIDVTQLTGDMSGSSANLVELMGDAIETLYDFNKSNIQFYANRTIIKVLRQQYQNQKNIRMDLEEVGGHHVRVFDGLPVYRDDTLLNTEEMVA